MARALGSSTETSSDNIAFSLVEASRQLYLRAAPASDQAGLGLVVNTSGDRLYRDSEGQVRLKSD